MEFRRVHCITQSVLTFPSFRERTERVVKASVQIWINTKCGKALKPDPVAHQDLTLRSASTRAFSLLLYF